MNRGRRAEVVFDDADDYGMFIDLMKETSEMWNIRIAAYCLMPNHYHMLVQTPAANISRSMRHLNGVYTQRYNRRHHCDGQLFRGRYKSTLVGTDSYLLQVVRYIHRNPIHAGLADSLDAYKWSSHKGYVSVTKKWDWLFKEYILARLSKNRKDWLRYYRKWVSVEKEGEVGRITSMKRWPAVLGPKEFLDGIKEMFGPEKTNEEIPSSRELLPDAKQIIEAVCDAFGVATSDLRETRRGQANDPRSVAIYLVRRLRRDTAGVIASYFGIEKDSTVNTAIDRLKKRLCRDKKLSGKVREIEASIKMSQEQAPPPPNPLAATDRTVLFFEKSVAYCAIYYMILSMIKSFKHKGLRKFFETGSVSGVQPGHKQKLRIRLIALDTATCIDDMNTPGWRLHSLKGDRQRLWAIDVNRNWRIVFEFKDGNAYVVDYEDYH
jgi:plasmid maintenance system killer protein/REP element-mobilizing transposase RayT